VKDPRLLAVGRVEGRPRALMCKENGETWILRRLLVEAPLRVHHGSLPRATNNATRAPSRRRMSTLRKNPNFSLVPPLIV